MQGVGVRREATGVGRGMEEAVTEEMGLRGAKWGGAGCVGVEGQRKGREYRGGCCSGERVLGQRAVAVQGKVLERLLFRVWGGCCSGTDSYVVLLSRHHVKTTFPYLYYV